MLTIGVDAHRRMLSAVGIDEAGREVGHWSGRNTAAQWAALLVWAEALAAEADRRWGIEGSGHAGHGLAQVLLGQGAVVYEVNPRLTAQTRARSRRTDKSDQADARAIARLVRQEGDRLPRQHAEDQTAPLAVLTREREQLQADLTRERNRLHAELVWVEPDYRRWLPKLTTPAGLEAVLAWTPTGLAPQGQTVLQAAQRRVRRMQALAADLAAVAAELRRLSRTLCQPLTTLSGVAELSAGMLAGYLGPGRRFATEAQLAQYAGVAPLETASAGRTRHRLNRHGQRRLNELIHRIALTQSRCYPPAQAYLARRQADGKSWREALRALKRYIARAIWQAWNQCLAGTAGGPEPVAGPEALT